MHIYYVAVSTMSSSKLSEEVKTMEIMIFVTLILLGLIAYLEAVK